MTLPNISSLVNRRRLLKPLLVLGIFFASLAALQFHKRVEAQGTAEALPVFSIAHVYHGVPLDKELRAITLDRKAVEQIQQSLIRTLSAPRPAAELPDGLVRSAQPGRLDPVSLESAIKSHEQSWSAMLLAKQAIIERTVAALPAHERTFLTPRVAAIRVALFKLPGLARPTRNSDLAGLLDSARTSTLAAMNLQDIPPAKSYIEECAANAVPIPPNWPDQRWVSRGILPPEFTFASFPGTVSSEVFTYEEPTQKGICYALPRRDDKGSIEAMGIICQSQDTGKACFWDNIDAATGDRITGAGPTMEIAKLKNGFGLEENCTECHRGGNAYMIHPKTPLGALKNRNPKVRYSPIGQSTWSNPPALAERDSGPCTECHEIAAPNPSYCSFLKRASEKTMPKPESPSGWATPTEEFKIDIEAFKTKCP